MTIHPEIQLIEAYLYKLTGLEFIYKITDSGKTIISGVQLTNLKKYDKFIQKNLKELKKLKAVILKEPESMTSSKKKRTVKDDVKAMKKQLFAPVYYWLYYVCDNVASFFWWKYEREL